MTDILGKEIVGFDEAVYLKEMGFNGECTGYYHCEENDDEDSYECVGWRGLFRNSFSKWRAAAPSVRAAKLWYTKNKVKPFSALNNLLIMRANELMVGDWVYAIDDNGEKHPCRANNLEYDYTNKRGDFCDDFYGTGYEAEWPDVAFNVEPIPLTPEILEKNGYSRNGLDIALFDRKGGDDFVGAANLQYVHELQHALRLCGINKEIVL